MALTRKVSIKMFADTAEANRKLDAIDAAARRLGELNPEIKVKLETAAASAKMAVLRQELRSAGKQADETRFSVGRLGKSLDSALPGFAGMASAGIALGPAVLPVLAAATAGAIGLGAAMAGAGAALGIFGLAAKGNLTEMQKALTKVQAANKSAALAEQTAASKRTAAQKQAITNAHQLTAAFQKEFGAEAGAIEKLKSAWKSFTTQPTVTNAIAAGARLLTAALPHLAPLLRLGAAAVQAFEGALSGFVVSGGLDRLVAGLVKIGRIALGGFLAVLHNLAVAFGALSGGASGFAAGAVAGLVKLSGAFARWAQNKGPGALTGLMNVVRKLGPGVVTLISSLAKAVPNLVAGFSPLAPLSLALAGSLAQLVANVPPGVITAIALAFVAWTVAAKGLMAAGALGDAWKAVAKFAGVAAGATAAETLAAAGTAAWTVATTALGIALDALPFVVVAAAVVALAVVIIKYHKQIWAFIQRVWDNILRIIGDVFNWVKHNWPLLLGILTGPIGLAVVFIVKHFTLVKDFIRWAWDQIQIFSLRAVKGVLDSFSHIPLIGGIFKKAANAVGGELTRIQKDSATTWGKIQAGMDSLHGKKVALIFHLDLPPGVTYPSRHIKGHGARGIQGAAAGTWLVGEEGPELAYLPQGTHVLPAGPTSRMMGGLAGGTLDSFSASFPSARGLTAAFQAAVNAIAQEVKNLIGVLKVHVPGGGGGALGGDPGVNKALAARIFPFGASQWAPFVSLEMREAGFNRFARNPSSGAYGIPQALPPTKLPFAAQAAGGSHAGPQLGWMFQYIAGRYDSPANAWAHEVSAGWYGNGLHGTFRRPTLIGVGERGPERVDVTPGGHGPQVVIRIGGRGYGTLERALAAWIRETVHVEGGGDVQIAFGSS